MKNEEQNDTPAASLEVDYSPSFRRSPETEILIAELEKLEVGAQVTYHDMHQSTGLPEEQAARLRSCLTTARKHLQKEKRMVFAPVNGVGIKRLDDEGIVSSGKVLVQRANRMLRRGLDRTLCAKVSGLGVEARREYNVVTGTLAALSHVSDRSTQTKAQQLAASRGVTKLDVGDIYRLAVRK